jgi:hypothetical protein
MKKGMISLYKWNIRICFYLIRICLMFVMLLTTVFMYSQTAQLIAITVTEPEESTNETVTKQSKRPAPPLVPIVFIPIVEAGINLSTSKMEHWDSWIGWRIGGSMGFSDGKFVHALGVYYITKNFKRNDAIWHNSFLEYGYKLKYRVNKLYPFVGLSWDRLIKSEYLIADDSIGQIGYCFSTVGQSLLGGEYLLMEKYVVGAEMSVGLLHLLKEDRNSSFKSYIIYLGYKF